MEIFGEIALSSVLENQSAKLRAEVDSQHEDYILNVNETEFVEYLVGAYSVECVELNLTEKYLSSSEKDVPAEYFPRGFSVQGGRTYKKNVVKYHIPFAGDHELLRCVPSRHIVWTTSVSLEDGCICFEVINFRDDPEEVKRRADETIGNIARQASNVHAEVDAFNSRIRIEAQHAFQARKQRYLKTNNFLASLGVPIKKRDGYSSTFTIPSPRITRSVNINRPRVNEVGYKPDPSLDESTYNDILQVIHAVGRQFERMPSTYSGKHEEDLRDHFLLFLEPRFEGSSTGETFNKSGKTDILLRYEGSNAFIAECKFWKGSKAYLETISQLLGYLTWRDSKSAVILFVRNKDFSSVIAQVESHTPTHPNYLGFVRKVDSTWLDFRFHINDDQNREVKLAVLLFHLPQVSGDYVAGISGGRPSAPYGI
jgi:hypothetical protein